MAAETWRLPFFCLMGLLATAGLASAVQPDLSCFGLGFVSNGAIVPRVDIVREVGEQYEAFCIFDSTRIKAENVYFRTRIGSINERLTHKKVNDSAIALNMTHSEASKYVLQCMADNSWLCSRQVLVGYQPQDVENFTCISRNWKTLNCSWSVPDNPITVQYNLTYVVPGFLDTRNCPSSSKNWCFFPPESFHERDLVNMTIIAKNKKGVRQFNHIISQFSAVIPNEASGLVADVLGPHEVNVSWSLPHPIDAFPGNVIQELMYKITHYGDKPVLDDDWKMVDTWEVKIELFTSIKYYKVIDILSPYVEYQFRVRLHTGTGPIRENMWSRPATVSATTFATQPTKAPEITTGMFEVEDLRFNRNINVMWQELDPIDWNGPDFAYIVKIYNNQDNSLIKTSERTTVPYTKLQNLSRFIPYRLEIVPVNSNGPLAGENVQSSVVVPEMSLILDAPKSFRVIAYTNEESTTYGVRWQLQDQSADIKRATIYWCRQKQYENWCETKLHWRKVDNPTQGAVNLTELEQSTRYKFGVSLESNESSSGIKFISCVALYGTVPAAIETFKKTQVTPNSVTLAWNLDCRAESAVVQGFNISYCQVPTLNATMECSENTENYALVEGESETKYEVEGLHPHSHYHFSIATQTALGLSHWSKPVIATTQTDYPSGAPQDLRVNQTGREWVQMAWAPPLPKDRNGYIVEYRAWIDNNRFKKVTARMPITMWNITNLEAYADYTIDIKACTEGGRGTFLCGNSSARITIKTNIGVPKRIEFIEQPTNDELKWDGYDEQRCNGPHCTFELEYVINGTTRIHTISADHISTNIGDLNITCTDNEEETAIKLRPVGMDEDGQRLEGPWSDKQLSCFPPAGLAWWIILIIASVGMFIALVVVFIATRSWEFVKTFISNCYRVLAIPIPENPKPQMPRYGPWNQETKPFKVPNDIKCSDEHGLISDRTTRNPSGDSGTSVADPTADSSGCSTGGDSDCSSGTDSGTVQEDPGLLLGKKTMGEVRLTHPNSAPPYVCQGPPVSHRYVSVPNLAVGFGDVSIGSLLPQSTPGLDQRPLGTEDGMNGRRTSTGYFSMPTNESKEPTVPLSDFTLPLPERQGYLPAYSRHNYPYKKAFNINHPYIKAQSLPWLNDGYVAVAQAEALTREAQPQTRGYVAVGNEGIPGTKRQSSLLSLPMDDDKTPSTPDEDLPPGAYCRVGARDSPATPPSTTTSPSPDYVSVTPDLAAFLNSGLSSPSKSPYVTCAMAEALVSPIKQPEKPQYVSVGDMSNGRWANPVFQTSQAEENRDVLSAPAEGSRGRQHHHHLPTRPNTTDNSGLHHRANRFTSQHPFSKASSGYVSQEMLPDTVVMSPKKLIARSQEPHSVVYSPNHNSSMV